MNKVRGVTVKFPREQVEKEIKSLAERRDSEVARYNKRIARLQKLLDTADESGIIKGTLR